MQGARARTLPGATATVLIGIPDESFSPVPRQNSAVVAIPDTALPIFPPNQLREATQGNGTGQNCQTDPIPTVPAQRHDAETVQQSDERHQQKEGAGDETVHSLASECIGYARCPHDD